MYNAPISHQPVRGYPVDATLRNAARAQRGTRRRSAVLRVVTARLRRGTPAAQR
jgi:hypothetical protein